MITKKEFHEMLENQFGIYLNSEKSERAFQRSLDLLEGMDFDNNADVFYSFIHTLILDILDRINTMDSLLRASFQSPGKH